MIFNDPTAWLRMIPANGKKTERYLSDLDMIVPLPENRLTGQTVFGIQSLILFRDIEI